MMALKRFTRGKARIVHGDVLAWAEAYTGPQFHALLSDPPYELNFMGRNWDRSGIVFNADTWRLLTSHLLPGAFGMVFASARGYHRVACALEDAGLILHPSILGWNYGSGFPKAARIDAQMDRKSNRERVIVGKSNRHRGTTTEHGTIRDFARYKKSGDVITQSSDPLAKAWQGHRYGLQALKPALEPILVFQKSYEGKPLDSIVKYGSGALNIDGARILTSEKLNGGAYAKNGKERFDEWGAHNSFRRNQKLNYVQPEGRWPANFYVDEEAARRLDKQSGLSKSVRNSKSDHRSQSGGSVALHDTKLLGTRDPNNSYDDSGGASRFFFNVASHIDESDPVFYSAKVSKKERNAGLSHITMRELKVFGNFQGTESHSKKINVQSQNTHPTLKPISLCKWLATLLLPPEAYAPRRILVPFSGTSSEMIGALQAGWNKVLGVEQDLGYVRIAKKRISYWIPRK